MIPNFERREGRGGGGKGFLVGWMKNKFEMGN
jgi:hypothetical protein